MLEVKPQAFLALPPKDDVSSALAKEIAKVLKEQGVEPTLSTELALSDTRSDQIQSVLRRADVVVADLTGRNPNVLFEVGMAMGLRKPVLLISQDSVKGIPFDLHVHRVAVYRPDDVATVRRYVELWLRGARRQSAD